MVSFCHDTKKSWKSILRAPPVRANSTPPVPHIISKMAGMVILNFPLPHGKLLLCRATEKLPRAIEVENHFMNGELRL
jgi:hypothetical protein